MLREMSKKRVGNVTMMMQLKLMDFHIDIPLKLAGAPSQISNGMVVKTVGKPGDVGDSESK